MILVVNRYRPSFLHMRPYNIDRSRSYSPALPRLFLSHVHCASLWQPAPEGGRKGNKTRFSRECGGSVCRFNWIGASGRARIFKRRENSKCPVVPSPSFDPTTNQGKENKKRKRRLGSVSMRSESVANWLPIRIDHDCRLCEKLCPSVRSARSLVKSTASAVWDQVEQRRGPPRR